MRGTLKTEATTSLVVPAGAPISKTLEVVPFSLLFSSFVTTSSETMKVGLMLSCFSILPLRWIRKYSKDGKGEVSVVFPMPSVPSRPVFCLNGA
jgi:hypothetical protein